MQYLIALVAVLTVASLLNLLLVVGVIRRLRDHGDRLAALPASDNGFPDGFEPPSRAMLSVGEYAATFSATSTRGESITQQTLLGQRALVAFLSPDCNGCLDQLPHLVEYASTFPEGRDQVLAVLGGTDQTVEKMRAQLDPYCRIVVEPWGSGAIAGAFHVLMWPSFALLDPDGRIAANGIAVRELPVEAPAGA